MEKIRGGFYLKARKSQEGWIAHAPPHVREIWDYLIHHANFKDHGKIKRGQILTSYKEILDGLSWYVGYRKESYKKYHCEIAMKLLTKQQMVTTTKTTRGFIVTILNYDKYQDPKNYESHNETDKKATREPQGYDRIREEREEREEREYKDKGNGAGKKGPPPCPHLKIISLYHQILPTLPRVQIWDGRRESFLRSSWQYSEDRQDMGWWRRYFNFVSRSEFLMGLVESRDGRKPFKANLEWLVKPANMTKVIERNYHEDDEDEEAGPPSRRSTNAEHAADGPYNLEP